MRNDLGDPLADAFAYAAKAHREQRRKGTQVPYISHPLGVCSLVLEDGGTEEEAMAALLHDTAEDQGGRKRLADIQRRFGDRVAEIVEACTDTLDDPKPPWRSRKESYIAHLRESKDEGALRVSLADKLYNTRAILRDYAQLGEDVWNRFTADRDEILWYYRSLVEVFRIVSTSPMRHELEATVAEIERLAAQPVDAVKASADGYPALHRRPGPRRGADLHRSS